ncbi:hypothetical protein ACEPPN_019395 [Leptodophora sp. 'Broadleaf-Isolate-01']
MTPTPSTATTDLAELEHEYLNCRGWIQGVAFGVLFEVEFGSNCCKLDAVATHLSRWGTAMGFSSASSSSPSPEECTEQNIRNAKQHLSAVHKAFSRAAEDAAEFLDMAEREETKLLDSQTQIGKAGEDLNALHRALQLIGKTREPTRKTTHETKLIPVYEKDNFDGLVRVVSTQIRRLNALFPSLKREQTSLASDELRTVKDARPLNILWLQDIVKSDDEFLKEALEIETSSKRDFYRNITVKGRFKGQFGNQYAKGESSKTSASYEYIEADGDAVVHFGSTFGFDASPLDSNKSN